MWKCGCRVNLKASIFFGWRLLLHESHVCGRFTAAKVTFMISAMTVPVAVDTR